MDTATDAIVRLATDTKLAHLPDATLTAAKARVLDSYACAWGAAGTVPVEAAKRAFLSRDAGKPAHLVTGEGASVAIASFVNSLMTRYLDFNDAHQIAYGHPSDMILPLFNVAEECHPSGGRILEAIVVAYQIACGVELGADLHTKRWETAFAQAAGTAVGAGMLMGLSAEQLANAAGIAFACSSPLNLRKTDSQLTMWKGAAGPQASRVGVEAALLAEAGMTGPVEAFSGPRGIFERMTGEFDVVKSLDPANGFHIENTTIKVLPVSGRNLSPVETILRMRPEIGDFSTIRSIEVATYDYCYEYEQLAHPALVADAWNPGTREAADHSMRWLLAVALIDGAVTIDSYQPDRLARPDTRELTSKITFREDPALTAQLPDEWVSVLTVTTTDGRTVQERAGYPTGHPRNPATPAALRGKADALVSPRLGTGAAGALISWIEALELNSPDELFTRFGALA